MSQLMANNGEKATAIPATKQILANLRRDNSESDEFLINKLKRIGKMNAIAKVPILPWFIEVKTTGENA